MTGEVTNLATIVARGQPDPDPSNDSAAAQVNGQPAADIGVAKTVDNPSPAVGTMVTFTVTATNAGPSPATGVVVTDALPAGLTLVSATPSQGSYTAPTWTVGDLNVGTPATLTIVASVDAPGALVNQAQKTQQIEADPNPTNDSASVSLNAAASANLRILKTQTLTRGVGRRGDDLQHRRGQPGAEPGHRSHRERRAAAGDDVRLRGSRAACTTRPPASGPSALSERRRAPCSH